jgi:phosphoribosylformylglycinamidine (FGAM) synthase-like enzyme
MDKPTLDIIQIINETQERMIKEIDDMKDVILNEICKNENEEFKAKIAPIIDSVANTSCVVAIKILFETVEKNKTAVSTAG